MKFVYRRSLTFVSFRVILRLYSKVGYIELEEDENELSHNNHMFQSIIETKKESSPFSSKMVRRESDIPHSNSTTAESNIFYLFPKFKEQVNFILKTCIL